MDSLKEIAKLINSLESQNEICEFFNEILTEPERSTLSKRWRILNMLYEGKTQREIAKQLKVSLCKITRGAKIIKDKNAVTTKYLIKEKKENAENKN